MSLGPLAPRPSAAAAAEAALRGAILSGELGAGARLPPERALCATLGVSRLTLRAALAALASAGLLDVRQGSGYTVRDVRTSGGADLLPALLAQARDRGALPAALDDLLRLRRHLAAAVLDALAARPPSAARRRAVARAVEGFAAAAATADPARVADADLEVVRALLDATGSLVLAVALNPITAVVRGEPALRAALYATPEDNLAGWRALLGWLERPTPGAVPAFLAALADRDRRTAARLRRPPRSRP